LNKEVTVLIFELICIHFSTDAALSLLQLVH